MLVRHRFAFLPVAYALVLMVAAAPPTLGAPSTLADDLPKDVERQIDEQTEELPEELRDTVRKQISEMVRKELAKVAEKKKKAEEDAEKDDEKSADKSKSDKDEKDAGDAAADKDKGADEKSADKEEDLTAKEVKKLREEVELQEARFKHSVAMYEKQLEEKRLRIEKAKINRRLEADLAAEEQIAAQREVDRLRLEVELQKRTAEAKQLRIDAKLAEARADHAMIEQSFETEDVKEKLEERVLGDEQYPDEPFEDGVLTISVRRIELNGPIFRGAADYVCQRLDYFNNQSEKPIFLVIDDCPGGSAIEGFQIVQAIEKSKAPVHVVIKRMAASMAAIIATLADHSYCYPDALVLHHQASAYLGGTGRDIEDQMRQFKEISHRLIGAVAKKLGMSEKEFVDQMYKNRTSGDWELFGDEAVEKGWIEHVATTIREEGVRNKPKGMRNPPSQLIIIGEKSAAPAAATSQGYLERYEVELKEQVDAEGKRYVQLPRLSPLDAYLIYNPDGYYR
jgi:ATP-dependent Clp protease protease subunit